MARCEQGYLCDVCGDEVENISDSDLYLRFVTGQIASGDLLAAPERHLLCNPFNAQFIDTDAVPRVYASGDFDRRQLDDEYVQQQSQLLTRGWQRLQELAALEQPIPLADYPLPEFRSHGRSSD